MPKIYFFLFGILFSLETFSQTGPAGIQTSASNVFWVKADAGTSTTVNATPMSSWNDQSGNGIDLSQVTANKQPSFATNVMNGFPAVRFDNINASNDKMSAADNSLLDNTTGYSFFIVTRPEVLDGNARCIISKRTNVSVNQSFMHFFYSGNDLHTDIQTTDNRYQTNTAFSANTSYLITQQYEGALAAASRCRTYIAGNLDITAAETNASIPDNASPLIIGSTDDTDPRPFGGYISEVIIYRTALTAASRIIVENYLSSKYNIALAVNDKYAGDIAANGDYDREVAGIGQESSGSSTSFSASVSGGLTISANSGLNDGDYVLVGHAQASNTLQLTDVGGLSGTATKARWQRVWYMDVTNVSTTINANIEFDMSDGGHPVALGLATNYKLLYRAGLTGNWTELASATAIAGDRVQFSNINLVNDGYYTLGSADNLISPLPVELLSFVAGIDGSGVLIKWKTASEKNSEFFVVEKSSDGETFEKVAALNAAGNSWSQKNYQTRDNDPLPGLSYYRLREISTSGESTFSGLVSIDFSSDPDFMIYPNPSAGLINITSRSMENNPATIIIYDTNGKICFRHDLQAGLSQIQITPNLKPGFYYFSLNVGGTVRGQNLVIK